MKRKTLFLLFTLTFAMLTTSGCNNTTETKKQNSSQQESTDSTAEPAETDSPASLSASELFSERDMDISYDEDSCIRISLNDKNTTCDSDAVKIAGTTVTITKKGNYILSGTLSDGTVIVDIDKSDKVQLILDGASVSSASSSALYIKQADKVFLTTAANSKNTLANAGSYQAIDDNNIDAAIFSKEDLTLNGAGSLTVKAEAGHGIVSKDDLVLTSGTYEITAASHGLSGKDSVCIADGDFQITAGKDGIHAENKDDDSRGFVFIGGGNYQISSDDDGIHANTELQIADGKIEIPKCNEGIEGQTITISGGDISLVSADDGINAAGGTDSSEAGMQRDEFAASDDIFLNITGGKIRMKVSGDGLDSNGNLSISGGEIYISGPENSGNGSLDYNGEGKISGGTVVAAGAMGMAQNFDSASTQGSILATTESGKAGDTISLTDSSGTELLSWQTEVEYSCVLISHSALKKRETYTLKAGTGTQEITMSELIYGEGGMHGGMGGGKDGFGGGRDRNSKDGMGGHGQGGKGRGMRPDGQMPEDDKQSGRELPL